ncbi:MAG: AAA family ATPase, partial [Nitrosopumilales archaeon]
MGNDALIECIDGIIKKSKIDHRLQPGDYLREDGLYCCHKCKTPKQVEIFILGRHEKPYCMCECESKQWDIDNTEDKQAKWELNRDRWLDGEIYKEWKFEVDDKKSIKMSNAMFRYVQKFEEMKEKNQGLLFCGDIGTGKSFFAAAIVNELISQGYQACMITTINAVNYMTSNKTKADVSEKWQKLFKNSDLVVFDELDGERDTSFMTEQIYKLIDDRLKTN